MKKAVSVSEGVSKFILNHFLVHILQKKGGKNTAKTDSKIDEIKEVSRIKVVSNSILNNLSIQKLKIKSYIALIITYIPNFNN